MNVTFSNELLCLLVDILQKDGIIGSCELPTTAGIQIGPPVITPSQPSIDIDAASCPIRAKSIYDNILC